MSIERRTLLQAVAIGAGAGLLAPGSAVVSPAAGSAARARRITIAHSVNTSLSASPDAQHLALDLPGGIWRVPLSGGTARLLTPLSHDASRPHWSPGPRKSASYEKIVFQSFRNGVFDLAWVNANGGRVEFLTKGLGYDLEPRISPDGNWLAYSSDAGHRSRILVMDLRTRSTSVVSEAAAAHAAPAWSPDGRRICYVVGRTALATYDLVDGTRRTVASGTSPLNSPSYASDGRLTWYRTDGIEVTFVVDGADAISGEDLAPTPAAWIGQQEIVHSVGDDLLRRRLDESVGKPLAVSATLAVAGATERRSGGDRLSTHGVVAPAISRDGSMLAFTALNALWTLDRGSDRPVAAVRDGYMNIEPDFFPDGKSLVFVSDRSGTPALWRLDLATRRATRLPAVKHAQLAPRVSPDGDRIAYLDQTGGLWVLTISSGTEAQVMPALYQPGRPDWSPDSRYLTLTALRPYSARYETGHNQLLTVQLATGEINYEAVAPEKSISTRGYEGPIVAPDGRSMIVVIESQPWSVPVTASGRVNGQPVRLSSDTVDGLALASDGTLAYLTGGRIVFRSRRGAPAGSTRLRFPDLRAAVAEPVVLHDASVWDGRSDQLRPRQSIVVRGGRIEAVVPAAAAPAGAASGQRRDLRGKFVIPGLIDTHNHWHMEGRQWGDRQGRLWLSYGVTSAQSPGDLGYQMLEHRESVEHGTRIAPRYFGATDALDGTRASYNCMRSVTDGDHLARELERARLLRSDLVKCYMRLSPRLAEQARDAAHKWGARATSHYLYPAAALGLDGMEHPGGGHRLGYSRTISSARFEMGEDSVQLLAATQMWVSGTLIFATEILAEDPELVGDRRAQRLFPAWALTKLEAAAATTGIAAEINAAITKGMVSSLLRVHRAGGRVVMGTDSPLDFPGVSAHTNLRAMVKHGFSTADALRSATSGAAASLGRAHSIGVVAPQLAADLVVLDADPLADIRNVARVSAVMTQGRVHTIDDLLRPFGGGDNDEPLRRMPRAQARTTAPLPSVAAAQGDPLHQPGWTPQDCC